MYEILIGESIGNVKLGMTREQVAVLFENLEEVVERPFGYDFDVIFNYTDDFIISYDRSGLVNFICCTSPGKLTLKHSKVSLWQLFYYTKSLDADLDIDKLGFISNLLGFGVSVNSIGEEKGNEIIYDAIESVQVAVSDFWKNEPKLRFD